MERGPSWLARPWPLPSRTLLRNAYLVAGALAGAISLVWGQSQNFSVFRAAALALLRGDDLYVKHAADYFKYSPTFALLFVPFAWAPAPFAAPLWSLINFAVAFWGIDRVVEDDRRKRVAMCWALGGILLSTDGDQSNLLVAGAILLAFGAYERRQVLLATQLVVCATFVKVFPIVAAAFASFQPRRLRSFAVLVASVAVWASLPLIVISPRALAEQYASWQHLLAGDHANAGWSAMSLLKVGLGLSLQNPPIQALGACVQGIPILVGLRFGTDAAWRRTLVCSLLCFVVLFNHRAESAEYVLPAIGAGIWVATSDPSPVKRVLVLLSCVAPGPFFARPDPAVTGWFAFIAAHRLFHPLRVLPLLLLWLFMLRDLVRPLARHFRGVTLRSAASPVGTRTSQHAP
jgi:hypothetical protein